jgi:hypothetical protein
MSEFSVVVDVVAAAAARLGSISGDLDGVRAGLSGRAAAGAGTVVDLNGYNPAQVARIQSWIDALPPELRARVIQVGR